VLPQFGQLSHRKRIFSDVDLSLRIFNFQINLLPKNVTEWLLTSSSSSSLSFCLSFSVTREISPETVPKRVLHKVDAMLRISISRIVHYPKFYSLDAYVSFFVLIFTLSFLQCVTSFQPIVPSEMCSPQRSICCFIFQFPE